MKPGRRGALRGLGALALAHAGRARAADVFPARPVRLLVGQGPGGQTDLIARTVAQRLAEEWRFPVVVENVVGASGTIAARQVATAAPDGHTLLLGSSSNLVYAPAMRADVGYDALADFALVGRVARVTFVLVARASLPAADLGEFIRRARGEPGRYSISTVGPSSNSGVTTDLFAREAHIDVLVVPYKTGAPAVQAILAGEADATFCDYQLAQPHVASGALRYLAVVGARRAPMIPDVPTTAELGLPGIGSDPWYGLVAPAATPTSTIETLRAALARVRVDATVRARFDAAGYAVIDEPVPAFGQAIAADQRAFTSLMEGGRKR